MADKQFARSGTGDFDLLADDDPLSELARIVGYDNRPAVQQLQEIEKQQLLVRKDPVFDLEDELAREFDLYDAPPAMSVAPVEDMIAEEQPVFETIDEPFSEADSLERPVAVDEDLVQPAVDAGTDAEIEEPATNVVETVEPAPAVEIRVDDSAYSIDPVDRDGGYEAVFAVESHDEPVFEPASGDAARALEPGFEMRLPDETDFAASDLERELELSIGYDDAPADAAENIASSEPETSSVWDYAVVTQAQPLVGPTVEDLPVQEAASVAAEAYELNAAVQQDEAPVEPATVPPQTVPPKTGGATGLGSPETAEAVVASGDQSGIDALLADIERFPVPLKGPVVAVPVSVIQPEAVRKNNYPFTPTFSRATPTATGNGSSSQKAFATPLAVTPVAAPVITALADPAPEIVRGETVGPDAFGTVQQPIHAELEPDFDLDNFELDLSDIDLDLDLDAAELTVDAEPAPVEDVVPVVVQAPVSQEPVVLGARPAGEMDDAFDASEDVAEFVLPFDPAMISETEENLTTIADLEVPQLPVVEQDKPAAFQPDYDLDIDAEIAQLFGASSRMAPADPKETADDQGFAVAARSIPVTHAQAQPAGIRPDEEFDEFERAMEEDFRRSMSQRQDSEQDNDRLAMGADYRAADPDDTDRRSNGRRLGVIAAAVGGLLILGGAGVYAWMGGAGTGLGGSDPKIILADKSPVKLVPVEKGGKTVPNQDKAVYDRVAGAPDEALQQGALVSSTEEPIDVVQRTLTPETLPLEGSEEIDEAGVTPIDGDDSARLLPDGDEMQPNATNEDRATAVSPRKVRTMIVKPDGTLVAREEPVPEPVSELASVETPATADTTQPQIKTVKTTVITPQAQTETAASAQVDLRTQEQPVAEEQVVEEPQSALAEAAGATVDETAPVRTVTTTTVGEQAPVPQMRPAEQPVNVVGTVTDQGNVRPVQAETTTVAAAETTPVQTASVPAGTYVIQIASLPSEAEAQRSYTTLSGKFAAVIGGRGSDIRKAEIAGKGTYYRVRIPAGSREEANALCSRYKSAGGSCLVTK